MNTLSVRMAKLSELFNQRSGSADVDQMNCSGPGRCSGVQKPLFPGDKSRCVGGANSLPERFSGICIQSGGKIDGEDGAASPVDPSHPVHMFSCQGPRQSGTEECIDNPALFRERLGGRRDPATGLSNPLIDRGIGREYRGFWDWPDRDGPPCIIEMAGHDISVAAVVSGPGKDRDRGAFGIQLHQQFRATPPSIFHQDDSGHAKLFDR